MSWATMSMPADIQSDHLRGVHGPGRDGRMHPLGHVDGRAAGAQIGVAANEDDLPGRRDRVRRKALLGQHAQGDRIDPDLAQHVGVVFAAARVGVGDVDQLADRARAVADHLGRLPPGRRHHLAAHDQQAVVVARSVPFDQDGTALLQGRLVGGHDLLARRQVRRHAAALVAVLRLDDHRPADLFARRPTRLRRLSTGRPSGTGTPTVCNRLRVSSLSCAIDSAMALLRSVSAAWIRRCFEP